jgi:hypothetical protein
MRWVVTLLYACFVIGGVAESLRTWRSKDYYESAIRRTAIFFPFEDEVCRGIVRGQAPLAFSLIVIFPVLIIGAFGADENGKVSVGGVVAIAGLSLVALFILCMLFQLTIIWFNRPRWMVPPHARDEPTGLEGVHSRVDRVGVMRERVGEARGGLGGRG